jgi:mono/diheme cytochrome c family protein
MPATGGTRTGGGDPLGSGGATGGGGPGGAAASGSATGGYALGGAATGGLATGGAAPITAGSAGAAPPATLISTNTTGTAETCSSDGRVSDLTQAFYRVLGSNGRSCATCHRVDQGMSLTPAGATAAFAASDGADPLFRVVDGAVSPRADTSTAEARKAAYALLLSKGLIRVGLPIPANADFELVDVKDPYGYASAAELSLFRRPLPAANLRFLSTVMWDGREGLVSSVNSANSLAQALASQAAHAVSGHAQGTLPPTPDVIGDVVAFELDLVNAQATSVSAGALDDAPAFGGATFLGQRSFVWGVNDPTGQNPAGKPFDPNVFTLYEGWASASGDAAAARQQIAEGERIFNTRAFTVSDVPGLTTPASPTTTVTCSFCHDTPEVGASSVPRFFDLGLASAARAGTDLPVYTLREKATGNQVSVSDPGRALITGSFRDVALFKVPTLRGLAGRPPYFHNGAAATLAGVVGFYNGRFKIGLTDSEKAALAAFLASL